ncbi:hypothetical protein M441DRAFT_77087 [Trichoderma asperellum CBS 433.97]|uniref:MIT domain-containing protein n=1 Tax=Trichoderma asperellum (strain ATCC 204424 / CBS 433.97 / NBRC 101777) TaxID=1042311 RepID=A0A2T3ZGK6_TRIA4|nr:hypothetical protein M441DRAFT_77087 [Trichoderma asperellum CBS 433.97]PTB43938.1 hypothetical protein M441DRAFT_77087 [Trichoderma asperellum CBS 433.97]
MQQSHPFDDNIISRRANRSAPTEPSSPPPPPPQASLREAPGIEAVLSSPPKPPVLRSVFSSARLPRSSSLIPPLHGSPPNASIAANNTQPHHANASHQTHRGTVHPPVSLKRPSTPSSQLNRGASSGASPQEASQTRNRWSTSSISSASSRTSPYASRQASISHPRIRRASLEAAVSPPSAPPPPLPSAQAPRKPSYTGRSRFNSSDSGAMPTSAHPMRSDSSMSMRHYENGQLRSVSPNPYANTATTTTSSTARMPHEHHDPYAPRGHSRDHSGKSSRDLGKPRAQKNPSQKAMLSRALQKANTAVQLDNAQNFEGAREAYAEACDLLQQVLDRTSGDEDKRKLEAIRQTYTSRIDELDQMGPWQDEAVKALPARPGSEDYSSSIYMHQDYEMMDEAPRIETARVISIIGDGDSPIANQWQQSAGYTTTDMLQPTRTLGPGMLQSSFSRSPRRLRSTENLRAQSQQEAQYAPAPLSPRSPSPMKMREEEYTDMAHEHHEPHHQNHHQHHYHQRQPSDSVLPYDMQDFTEGTQNSWLDPIDESGASTASSVHSRTSSLGYRRRHIRAASGNTEAEFDTALDAAIEAAYDDGYEPMEPEDYDDIDPSEDAVASVMQRVEKAREQVRQTEQEAYDELAMLRQAQQQNQQQFQEEEDKYTPDGFYEDNSSEDEERLLDEITRDFAIEDFTMAQPQSNNATISASQQEAWNEDETRPDFISGVRSFSALSQRPPIPQASTMMQPAAPPPTTTLPELPKGSASPSQGVQNRKTYGQNPKQLKIETSNLGQSNTRTVYDDEEISPSTVDRDLVEALVRGASAHPAKQLNAAENESKIPGSPGTRRRLAEGEDGAAASGSPSIHRLKKNFSSSSLRSMKNRNMSVSHLDDSSDVSPGTPMGNPFGKAPAVPALPTPLITSFRDNMEAGGGAGLHLFDDNFHVAATPGPQSPVFSTEVPAPLEPCPNDFMLRPFWLMRCLYQTLVHPKGGYVSTKLFVPRDVWRVKGVKIKNIEDKVANCDYLTAALLKLAKVDTFDADAVLEEMQSLENVLEQVQSSLARKLGSEVGVQGSGNIFKDASMDGEGGSNVPRSGSVSGKASAFSWRRLRPKTSGVGLGGSYSNRNASMEVKEATTLATLPMTPKPTSRPTKRDVSQAQFIGPNAMYMGSLARLFDAAQAIDQIARQVEDPGLRHADKTQVGLELCTRHAAEFFGFYICRFVLADLGLLLDKFLKRGSEWVLT